MIARFTPALRKGSTMSLPACPHCITKSGFNLISSSTFGVKSAPIPLVLRFSASGKIRPKICSLKALFATGFMVTNLEFPLSTAILKLASGMGNIATRFAGSFSFTVLPSWSLKLICPAFKARAKNIKANNNFFILLTPLTFQEALRQTYLHLA